MGTTTEHASTQAAEPASPDNGSALMRGLLVDDDAVFRSALSRALTRRGLQILTAADVDCALAAMRSHQPDFVLLDLNLGCASGLGIIPALRHAHPPHVSSF